jgi:hypothetical protein
MSTHSPDYQANSQVLPTQPVRGVQTVGHPLLILPCQPTQPILRPGAIAYTDNATKKQILMQSGADGNIEVLWSLLSWAAGRRYEPYYAPLNSITGSKEIISCSILTMLSEYRFLFLRT